jgi:hypothetical protein
MKESLKAFLFFFVVSFFLTTVFFLCTSQAQSMDRLAFVGAGYFDGAQTKATTGFIKRFDPNSKLYNITALKIGMVPAGQGNISIAGKKDLQADFSSGVLYDTFQLYGVHVFGIGDIGLQQTGENPSFMFGAGGGLYKSLYKSLGIAIFGTWKYAEGPSRNFQWKVNPAAALTFGF